MMRRLLFVMPALLLGGTACVAQVSTIGTTAMGIPSTPGAIVSSPLSGPSPFSATTQPGAPVTTLAPVPLALDPTTPGTSVSCSPLPLQVTTATPPPVTASPAPTADVTTAMSPSTSAALGTIASSLAATINPNASATGTISPVTPLGSSTTAGGCTSNTGNPTISAAALPLSTPEIASTPAPGTIQPDITELGGTSIDPTSAAIPTPNSAACSENITMDLANPGMMAPANATGAAATPGVSPPGC